MSERNATTTQPNQTDIPDVPLVKCKEWCQYGDGHPGHWTREDQWCGSKQLTIDLHHIQSDADPVNKFHDNYLVTYVMQTQDADPQIHVGFGENSGWILTVEESVSLALALLDQAERIRRNAGVDTSLIGIPVEKRP